MNVTARVLVTVAVIFISGGCRHLSPKAPPRPPASPPSLGAGALLPSPRLMVGRIIAIDAALNFAFVELAFDAPAAAQTDGNELLTRTLDLKETGRLQATRQRKGRTLGTRIVDGQPSVGDEVVWLAP